MKYFFLKTLMRVVGVPLIRAWFFSLRLMTTPDGEHPSNSIVAFWHRDILAVIAWLSRRRPFGPMTALVSTSGDGDILTIALKHFGIEVVRGSSSRRGFEASLELLVALESGRSVLITPDGPKGPPCRVRGGIARLAALSGRPVVAVRVSYSNCRVLRTWDQFRLPKWFSVCEISASNELLISPSVEEVEGVRLLQDVLTEKDSRD